MVLQSRPISQAVVNAMAALAGSPGVPRPSAAATRLKPQVLRPHNAPAQLCFPFMKS